MINKFAQPTFMNWCYKHVFDEFSDLTTTYMRGPQYTHRNLPCLGCGVSGCWAVDVFAILQNCTNRETIAECITREEMRLDAAHDSIEHDSI